MIVINRQHLLVPPRRREIGQAAGGQRPRGWRACCLTVAWKREYRHDAG